MIKKKWFSRGDIERNIILPNKKTSELAEFMGILTGDGYMNHYRKYDYNIDITGNKLFDSDFIEKYVFNLAKKLFNVNGCIIRRNDQNTVYIRIRSRAILFYLKEIGFKTGYKGRIGIPGWIKKDNAFLISFIRGLFDTDGTLCLKNRKIKIYPVVSISSKSDLLMKEVQNFAKKNGISSYLAKDVQNDKRFKKQVIVYRLQINGYKNSNNWLKLIGSNNERIKNRFKIANAKGSPGFGPGTLRASVA